MATFLVAQFIVKIMHVMLQSLVSLQSERYFCTLLICFYVYFCEYCRYVSCTFVCQRNVFHIDHMETS